MEARLRLRSVETPAVVAGPARERVRFEDVFREHASFVWRSMRYLGVSGPDLEDGCQEVFAAVHRGLAGFEGRSSIRTWLYGICVRVASNHRKRAHHRRETITHEVPETSLAAPQADEVDRQRALEWLHGVLASFEENQRAVFVLYEIEGLTMPEIAEALGCPLQTAYSRLYAARRAIETAARPLQGGEP